MLQDVGAVDWPLLAGSGEHEILHSRRRILSYPGPPFPPHSLLDRRLGILATERARNTMTSDLYNC